MCVFSPTEVWVKSSSAARLTCGLHQLSSLGHLSSSGPEWTKIPDPFRTRRQKKTSQPTRGLTLRSRRNGGNCSEKVLTEDIDIEFVLRLILPSEGTITLVASSLTRCIRTSVISDRLYGEFQAGFIKNQESGRKKFSFAVLQVNFSHF